MFDILIKHANLPDDRNNFDIAIQNKKIVAIDRNIIGEAVNTIDATDKLVSPSHVDSHFHLDATLTLGQPRFNESGTLLEGIQLWDELKPHLTIELIKKRARKLCHWAIANGCLAIRSHVDISDDRLLAVEALLELRKEMRDWIDIQLVAFPQNGYLRYKNSIKNLDRALKKGVDVIGGIPHFERTMNEGSLSIKLLCELAAEKDLLVDMHCDESDDPMSRHVETLAFEAHRLGLEGRVTGSHLTSMHSMDNYYVSKLIPLLQEAELQVVANPLINITLQGRHDLYPKRRGMTRVKELLNSNINVAFGHDCVMDPWYSLGKHDMLEVANMGLHVGQMTGVKEMHQIFQAITNNGARVMQLDNYGIEVGCNANLVIHQANNPIEAIRLCNARLFVIRNGQIIAKANPTESQLLLNGEKDKRVIDWTL
ncbi:cytosine deaminase [Candidatus Thioglobus sp.]|jgi:cytosine deaminase|uniref:cytosine deaminase n=1 Tax=Candidatus Pseudothioglobus sp. Uisw_050_01 TaxID=3230997 RepID=UPI0023035D97|nr:cytosine deaminase [Candidatus Thioglobus sp.]MDB9803420.1 cytosine deaminase [Candidatus Thioglobus sp.]|tara:strand:- start:1142 stop:2419 length:1278 start_codon:yes stop_codon:yes gene_type:complete